MKRWTWQTKQRGHEAFRQNICHYVFHDWCKVSMRTCITYFIYKKNQTVWNNQTDALIPNLTIKLVGTQSFVFVDRLPNYQIILHNQTNSRSNSNFHWIKKENKTLIHLILTWMLGIIPISPQNSGTSYGRYGALLSECLFGLLGVQQTNTKDTCLMCL